MNFYRRFPGDYLRDTTALTLQQHGIYTLLLDYQYSTERHITDLKEACRIVHARTPLARRDTEYVLVRHFVFSPDGWINKRFEKELNHFQGVSYKRKLAALVRHGKHANAMQMDPYTRYQKEKESPNIELSQDHAVPPVEKFPPKLQPLLTIEEQKKELKRRGLL